MLSSIKKIQSMHVFFKAVILFGILGSWGAFLFWISLQTGISLNCQGCWGKSLFVFIVALALYVAACVMLFIKWPQRIGILLCGLVLFWLVMRVLESDTALVGIFINADPFLVAQEKRVNPRGNVQVSDMDTSHVFGIPPDAYMVNIKRWDMVRFLKGQEHRKGRSGQ